MSTQASEQLGLPLKIATAIAVVVLITLVVLGVRFVLNREPSAADRCRPYGGLAYVAHPYPGEEDVHCRDGHGWRITE